MTILKLIGVADYGQPLKKFHEHNTNCTTLSIGGCATATTNLSIQFLCCNMNIIWIASKTTNKS